MAISPVDDCFLTGSSDNTACCWDLRAPTPQGIIKVSGPTSVAFDSQGLVFAVGTTDVIKIYDARQYEKGPFATFDDWKSKKPSTPHSIKFSPDGKNMLVSTSKQRVLMLDAFKYKVVREFRPHSNDAKCGLETCFTPDGRYVISGTQQGDVNVWNAETGKIAAQLKGHPADDCVTCCAFNPRKMMLATAGHSLALWIPKR